MTALPNGRNRLSRRSYPMRNRDRGGGARSLALARSLAPEPERSFFHDENPLCVYSHPSFRMSLWKGRSKAAAPPPFPRSLSDRPYSSSSIRSLAAVDIRCFDYKHGGAVCSMRRCRHSRPHSRGSPPISSPFLHIE